MVVEGQAVDLASDGAMIAGGFAEVGVSGAQGENVDEHADVLELEAAQGVDGVAVGVVFESVGEACAHRASRMSRAMDGRSSWYAFTVCSGW
ncbi:hypothetical protein [Streptomyces alfalfae]